MLLILLLRKSKQPDIWSRAMPFCLSSPIIQSFRSPFLYWYECLMEYTISVISMAADITIATSDTGNVPSAYITPRGNASIMNKSIRKMPEWSPVISTSEKPRKKIRSIISMIFDMIFSVFSHCGLSYVAGFLYLQKNLFNISDNVSFIISAPLWCVFIVTIFYHVSFESIRCVLSLSEWQM